MCLPILFFLVLKHVATYPLSPLDVGLTFNVDGFWEVGQKEETQVVGDPLGV
jgi:hypothetical protein